VVRNLRVSESGIAGNVFKSRVPTEEGNMMRPPAMKEEKPIVRSGALRRAKMFYLLALMLALSIASAPPAGAAEQRGSQAPRGGAAQQTQQKEPITPEQAFTAVCAQSEKGDTGALITLGGFYAEGFGVQKNFSKARECYEKAAQAGMAEGIYNVGVCWEVGMGSAADSARAAEYFRRAAGMKLPQALFKMSVILDSGAGVERNEQASIDYMAQAAASGHPDAASIMGLVYLSGLRGQKQNTDEGMKMLKAAASSGNVDAMKNIAVVYKDGIGLKASPPEALKWYVIAEKCGYPAEALSVVTADLRKKLSAEQQRKAERDADEWIKDARAAAN
jgi:TPR repeat protein